MKYEPTCPKAPERRAEDHRTERQSAPEQTQRQRAQ